MVQLPYLFTFLQILTNKKKEVNMKNNERVVTYVTFPDLWFALKVLINCYNSEGDTIRHCQATCEALNDRELCVDGCWNCPDYDPYFAFHGRSASLNGDVLGILKSSWGIIGNVDYDNFYQMKRETFKDWLEGTNEKCSGVFTDNNWGTWSDIQDDIFIEWASHLYDGL